MCRHATGPRRQCGGVHEVLESRRALNWLAFAVSLVGTLCVMLLWQGFDTRIQRQAPQLRHVGSGLLFLAIAIPGIWLLPTQSQGIFFGAITGLFIAGAIDAVRRRELRKPSARG